MAHEDYACPACGEPDLNFKVDCTVECYVCDWRGPEERAYEMGCDCPACRVRRGQCCKNVERRLRRAGGSRDARWYCVNCGTNGDQANDLCPCGVSMKAPIEEHDLWCPRLPLTPDVLNHRWHQVHAEMVRIHLDWEVGSYEK